MIHSASDLLWTDGLHDMRLLSAGIASHTAVDAQPVGSSFALASLQDLTWYCEYKGLSAQEAVLLPVPVVQVSELLAVLGMPKAEHKAAMQHLTKAALPMLQQMALPDYLSNAVAVIEEQLSGLGIAEQHLQGKLFVK